MEHDLDRRFSVPNNEQTRADWDDVMHRAAARTEPVRKRLTFRRTVQRRPRLVLAACAVLGVLLAAPAFGVGPSFLPFVGSDRAPSAVVQNFASLDVGAPAGMAPGVIADETRAIRLSAGGREYTMWVAPTQSGGFCRLLEGGGGGCDSDRQLPLSVGIGKATPSAPILMAGSVLSHEVATLEIRYQDGTASPITMTWVSEPIDAALFVAEIAAVHQVNGSRPVEVVARGSSGDVLLRSDIPQNLPWNAWNTGNGSTIR
jgi:hypothetical protein